MNYTDNHDFMTENPATEQSMLAPHRVKPYHFKGMNAAQTHSSTAHWANAWHTAGG